MRNYKDKQYRINKIILSGILLLLLSCQSDKPKATGGNMLLLGDVRIQRTSGGTTRLLLPPQSSIQLRLEPERLATPASTESKASQSMSDATQSESTSPADGPQHRCNALERGQVDASLMDEAGKTVWTGVLTLSPSDFRASGDGYVGTLPIKTGNEGRWQLALQWSCDVPSIPSSSRLTFEIGSTPAELKTLDSTLKRSFKEGNYDATIAAGELLQQKASALGWIHEAAQADIALSTVAIQAGDARTARQHLSRAEQTLLLAPLPLKVQAMWSYRQALLQESLGQTLKALEWAGIAQKQGQRLQGAATFQGALLLELELLMRLGHTQAVMERLRRLEQEQALELPEVWNNIGWLLLQALETNTLTGAAIQEGQQHAARALERSIALYEQAGRPLDRDHPTANLAGLSLQAGRLAQAQDYLNEVRKIRPQPDEELRAYLYKLEGFLALKAGRMDAAFAQFTALANLPGDGLGEYRGWGFFGLGELARQQQKLPEAKQAYDRALRSVADEPGLASPLHRPSTLQRKRMWEGRAIQVRLALQQPLEALKLAEEATRQRWLALTSAPPSAALANAAKSSVGASLEALDQAIFALSRVPGTPENLSKLEALEIERQEVWASQRMQAGQENGAQAGVSLATLAPENWPKSQWLRRYVCLPDALIIFELKAGRWSVIQVNISAEQLEQSVAALVDKLQRGEDAVLSPEALWLRKHLLPVELPGQLVLVPDGPLRRLPWVGLPAQVESPSPSEPDTGAREVTGGLPTLLVERASVQLLPFLTWQSPTGGVEGAKHLAVQGLVVADPSGDLPSSRAEGQAVSALIQQRIQSFAPSAGTEPSAGTAPSAGERAGTVRLLIGAQATRAQLRQDLIAARLFHFAGHGNASVLRPYQTALSLFGEERLSLMEVGQLRLPGTHVFLNACGLGQTGKESGGAIGMAEALLASGASTVIAGLWDVEEEEAHQLARRYYPSFEPGTPGAAAEALARAIRTRVQELRGAQANPQPQTYELNKPPPTGEATPVKARWLKALATWSAYVALGQ